MQPNPPALTADLWLPEPQRDPPRRPALWDGRPFPGKCSADGCPNQASGSMGRWTGGAPGVGEFVVHGHCIEHLGAVA